MEQAVNLEEDDENNSIPEESSYSPMSVNQIGPSSQSQAIGKKRARPASNITTGLEKLAKSFDKMMKSYAEICLLIDVLKKKDNSVMYDFI